MACFNSLWAISMIGRRVNYLIPSVISEAGKLKLFYTDFWYKDSILLKLLSIYRKNLILRKSDIIPSQKVVSFNKMGMMNSIKYRLYKNKSLYSLQSYFMEFGKEFALEVAKHMKKYEVYKEITHFMGFTTQCLETFEMLSNKNVIKVINQFDAGAILDNILYEEYIKWPGWSKVDLKPNDLFQTRRELEWEISDVIIVNSNYTKKALLNQGVDDKKIIVIPWAYLGPYHPPEKREYNFNYPLRVLWVGRVDLAKGIQYLVEAIRELDDKKYVFFIVGDLFINKKILSRLPKNVFIIGEVPYSSVSYFYRSCDIFVNPTLSDNFSLATLEAMAHSLPVLITDNCGIEIENGKEGIIIRPGDHISLKEALEYIEKNRFLLKSMSVNSFEFARKHNLETFKKNILNLDSLLN